VNRTRAEDRFFESTRGRIVALLRRDKRTVDELADELGLTDNAIRAHLVTLERDGLVDHGEPRRGGGKPAFTYRLTTEADRLFPKAYGILLQHLLQVLGERLPEDIVADTLREVGHRIASEQVLENGPLAARVEAAVAMLGQFGGLAEAEETDDGYVIQGYSCPLATAVEGNPDTCLLAETLLTDVIGTPVHQACIHSSPPRCRFEVSTGSQ
jgi:predicted ArsR family transcriptional regulator